MLLSTNIDEVFRLTDAQLSALHRLGIETVRDVLMHFPSRYQEGGANADIAQLALGSEVTLIGTLEKLETKKSWKRRVPVSEGYVRDQSGRIKCMWFNQPYIAKMYQDGTLVRATGKVTGSVGKLYLANPRLERLSPTDIGVFKPESGNEHGIFAVYPESRGITSLWFTHAITKVLNSGVLDEVVDHIPQDLLLRYHLPTLKTALVWIHTPQHMKDAEAARKRFGFEEVFLIQVARAKDRAEAMREQSFSIEASKKEVDEFMSYFPFSATPAQKHAVNAILKDMQSGHPMSRLLEGDVGSGKTAVAATAAFSVVRTRPKGQDFGTLQVAYMAPTELLAKQHFESFIKYFTNFPINIGLITGSGCYKFPSKTRNFAEQTRKTADDPWRTQITSVSRAQLLKWVQNGEISILIGTHALIQKSVRFKDLALVIIDEQHRFGTKQRMALARKYEEKRAATEQAIDPLLFRDLSYRIRNCMFAVKKELGSGHKEVVYQRALAEEFTKQKLPYTQEARIPVLYRGKQVGTYVPDFVVDEKIIVELKALPFTGAVEKKQLWNYLKGSQYHVALLANFGPKELTIERVVYDKARTSASVSQGSASMPHLLSMTATPIPRTLALTLYGDLDLTLIDQMPPGRKPVKTEIVAPTSRAKAYEKIREVLASGRQAYIICPRIDEPDPKKAFALQAKSVKEEAKRLKKEVFPEFEITILHSKMKPAEKDKIMNAFAAHESDILVATSVVEVGVNVPNATVIMIEGAERFGLSQLHQLRGRVIRSTHQAYCFVCPETRGEQTMTRLKSLTTAKNGFELAEKDLAQRGPGELSGMNQWGASDIGMEALKNLKLVEAARTEAFALVESDTSLRQYPLLAREIAGRAQTQHFE